MKNKPRQVQLRRGTAAEHETFVGAVGEVTVDTTNNTLRVHDGVTPGGHNTSSGTAIFPENIDYVAESQLPTAENNYTWYRKYQSGWVEQGGSATAQEQTVTMPIIMKNESYACNISTILKSSSNNGACTFGIKNGSKTVQSFAVTYNGYSDWRPGGFEWTVKGMAA